MQAATRPVLAGRDRSAFGGLTRWSRSAGRVEVVATQPKILISPEDYLERERKADSKSEYVAGEVFAMAGVSRPHDALVNNLFDLLPQAKLKASGCSRYSSDVKVYLRSVSVYCYPDLSICCGEPKFQDEYTDVLLNPTAVFEVLSLSTKNYDLGDKSFYYRQNPSLRHVVLIWHDRMRVGHWVRRSEEEPWAFDEYAETDAMIALPEMKLALPLKEIYADVPL